jgi:hypothetical protein
VFLVTRGNWIKKFVIRCGIDKPGSCHLWRHSWATDMHRGGADIRYFQETLGHERMETTQIHTQVHVDSLGCASWIQGGAISESPKPCEDNEMRFGNRPLAIHEHRRIGMPSER